MRSQDNGDDVLMLNSWILEDRRSVFCVTWQEHDHLRDGKLVGGW